MGFEPGTSRMKIINATIVPVRYLVSFSFVRNNNNQDYPADMKVNALRFFSQTVT
jgi:hypothetical protein